MAPGTSPYAERRSRLAERMRALGGGVAIVPTARVAVRNADNEFPFRADSRFFWLTGFTEPQSVLVIAVDDASMRTALFCRTNQADQELWTGKRLGVDEAPAALGLDAAFPIENLSDEIVAWLAKARAVFYPLARDAAFDTDVSRWIEAVRIKTHRVGNPLRAVIDIAPLIDEMRLFKDAGEIQTLRRSATIAADAHVRAMRATHPGMHEYEVEAELLYEFRKRGAQSPAYASCVAGGANACVLHYERNDALLRDGDLLLIDAGCELDGYASDITRTFPINGRFSRAQRALYEIVLAAQHAAIAQVCPGTRWNAVHDAAVRVLSQGMIDVGLLSGSLDSVIESAAYRRFYMHGTGHWLGLDVHDAGEMREPGTIAPDNGERPYRALQPGMVATIEPGLYVRPADDVPQSFWNIGIRIEDDVLVTVDGYDVLTDAAPKAADDIERLMRS